MEVPFTFYFRFAQQGNGRQERLRYAQKVAALLYSEIQALVDTGGGSLNVAQPGGSQHVSWDLNNFSTEAKRIRISVNTPSKLTSFLSSSNMTSIVFPRFLVSSGMYSPFN